MSRCFQLIIWMLAFPALLLAHGREAHIENGTPTAPVLSEGRHGGKVLVSNGHTFELIFNDLGIQLFPLHYKGEGISVEHLKGEVMLRTRRGAPETFALKSVRGENGGASYFLVSQDFSQVRDGTHKATFRLKGIDGRKSEFSTVLRRLKDERRTDRRYNQEREEDPNTASGRGVISEASLREMREAYPITWCVVTGENLENSDETTIEYFHKGRLVKLCCKHCIQAFKENSQKYLRDLDSSASGKKAIRPAGSGSARKKDDGDSNRFHK